MLHIVESEFKSTRIAFGKLGKAEGLDEAIIDFFEEKRYEVSMRAKRLGVASCTYAEVLPPISQEDLEDFAEHFQTLIGRYAIDTEMFLTPEKIVISTY